jgi:hypothetical protein
VFGRECHVDLAGFLCRRDDFADLGFELLDPSFLWPGDRSFQFVEMAVDDGQVVAKVVAQHPVQDLVASLEALVGVAKFEDRPDEKARRTGDGDTRREQDRCFCCEGESETQNDHVTQRHQADPEADPLGDGLHLLAFEATRREPVVCAGEGERWNESDDGERRDQPPLFQRRARVGE